MKKPHKSVITALLPQNESSELIKERMLEAIHFEDTDIERINDNLQSIAVNDKELQSDALLYFYENKKIFQDEFINELEQSGVSSEEYAIYCGVVAKEWITGRPFDGVVRLKKSVHDYLQEVFPSIQLNTAVQSSIHELDNIKPLISTITLSKILSINYQMLYEHLENWKALHPNRDNISNGDIFLRRGLQLNTNLNIPNPYVEQDFISSYSIALTIAEQFSKFNKPKFPVHINGDWGLFEQRVLFFSPFIPNMEVQELEFGVIPSKEPLPIYYQGLHAGVHEYILDPRPFQK